MRFVHTSSKKTPGSCGRIVPCWFALVSGSVFPGIDRFAASIKTASFGTMTVHAPERSALEQNGMHEESAENCHQYSGSDN